MLLSDAYWLFWPETQALIKAFGNAPMRFVGGAIRDLLLKIPVKDVDLATPLPPEQVMELLSKSGIKTIATGIKHGTVTAVVGNRQFEITTLRRDVATDGRHAVVAYTDDWKEDAARRDFTMNALYADANGEVTDYFSGKQDALAGHVRFIGKAEERIAEDYLRILRFFRFYALYGKGEADKDALAACAAYAAKIETLSGERIEQEMFKLLLAQNCADTILLMQKHGVLTPVMGKEVAVQPLKKLPGILHACHVPTNPILALALLLRSTEGDVVEDIHARWKLSNADWRQLSDLYKTPDVITAGEKLWKKHIRSIGKDLFVNQAIINMAEGGDHTMGADAIALALAWQVPTFPLSGNELAKHGVAPGKEMGVMLKKLEQYWEEKDYQPTKEALLQLVR